MNLKDLASKIGQALFSVTPTGMAYNSIQNATPIIQNKISNWASNNYNTAGTINKAEPVYNKVQSVMQSIPSAPFQYKVSTGNNFIDIPSNVVGGMAQGVLNAPFGIFKGMYNFPQSKNPREAIGTSAGIVNNMFSLSFPKTIPQGVKNAVKQPQFLSNGQKFVSSVVQGAKTGAGMGGFSGALTGLEQGSNLPDPKEYITNLIKNTAGGAVAGGTIGGIAGGAGQAMKQTSEMIQGKARVTAKQETQAVFQLKPKDRPVYVKQLGNDPQKVEEFLYKHYKNRYSQGGAIDLNAKVGGDVTKGRLGDVYYHGTTAQNVSELKPGGVRGKMGEATIPGISVTKDYNTAAYYGQKNGAQLNAPIETSFTGKIFEADSVADLKQKLKLPDWSDESRAKIPDLLKKMGFDAVSIKGNGEVGEVVVTNPKAVQIKSNVAQPPVSDIKPVGGAKQTKLKVKELPKTEIPMQPNLQTNQPVFGEQLGQPQSKIQKEMPVVNQSTLPDIIPPGTKQRGFTTSVQEAPKINSKTKINVSGTYTPKSNKQLMGEAEALLHEGATIDFKNTQHLDQKVAATIKQAISQQNENPQAAANLYNNLSENLTEMGRGIQAASLLNKMSPEAIALSAAGKIKKYNLTATRKIPELTGEQVKLIGDKVEAITGLKVGSREHGIAVNELTKTINNFIPSSLADKAITVWKAGLLTSFRTHERNIVGNSIMYGSEVAKDIPATAADWVMSKVTGKRTLTPTLQGADIGARKGLQSAADIIKFGYDPQEAISKYDVHTITWGNNPVERFLKTATEAVYRPLGAEDKVFWHSAYARSMYDQAGAEAINAGKQGNKAFIENLVKNPTVEMATTALNDANYATFHDKSALSGIAGRIKQAAKSIPGLGGEAGKIVTEVLAPFTGVPSSIVGKTMAYSPIGLVKGAVNMGRVLVGSVPQLQRQAAQEVGRGVVGTGLFGIGAYLMSKGLMTGQPKDATEANLWAAQGKQANSVLIDGKWRSIGSIGPQNLVILAGAKYNEEMNKPDGSLAAYGMGLGKDQLAQTFLQGVQQPIAAINDPARYGKSYLGNQFSSIVPNFVKDISKAFDPYQRENNTVKDYFTNSIPGLRNYNISKRDVLGNIMPQEPTGIGAFFDLFNSKTPIDNKIINEISRLYKTDNNALPSKLTTSQTILKQKAKLTYEQLNNLEAGVGEALKPKLEFLISDPNYQKLSDEEKTKAIDKLVQDTRLIYKNTHANDILSGKSATGYPQVNTTVANSYIDQSGKYNQIDTKPIPEPTLTGNKIIDDKLKLTYKNAVEKQAADLAKVQQTGTISDKNKIYSYVDENGAYKTIDLTPIKYPTLTGNDIVDKKLKSAYYSDINSQINDVIKLGQSGQITQAEMIKMVTDLNEQYTKGKGTTKKITFKKISSKKFKVSMPKIAKITNIKVPKPPSVKIKSAKSIKSKAIKIKPIKLAKIKGLTKR
jgi:hypothetical protein